MDYRRNVLPPVLALALSAALHAGLGSWNPRLAREAEQPDPLPVVVEYLPTPGEGGGAPPEAPGAGESPGPAAPPTAQRGPEPRPEPEPEPTPVAAASEPAAVPPAEQAPLEPAPPAPPAAPSTPPASAPDPAPAETPPASQVAWADLMPRASDVRPRTTTSLPDPAGEGVREATLTLGEADVRYKGYLEQVQASIDRTWRWKEALLAARGGGKVLLRFTLGAGGAVEEIGVVESSGNPILDREAVEAVRRAPLPSLPSHWTIERLHLFAEFAYRLE